MKQGELSKTPIKVDDKWVIVGIVKRIEPDFTAFNNGDRERLRDSLLSSRQTQVFEDYIARVQQKMKQDGKIKIYEDVLNRIDETEAASEPDLPQGLNFPTK